MIGDCPLTIKRNITKRGSVWTSDSFACIGVGTARLGNMKTRAFNAVSVSSAQTSVLFHVIA